MGWSGGGMPTRFRRIEEREEGGGNSINVMSTALIKEEASSSIHSLNASTVHVGCPRGLKREK